MKPEYVDLDRQFVPWAEKEFPAYEFLKVLNPKYAQSWPDLLKKARVIILAEAGAGKSEELKARKRALAAEGKFAFYATVQAVAEEGLDAATGASADVKRWRESEDDAWLFIDSVDEAKLNDIRLEKALRKIADGISGAISRAHVIISGRYYDWEFHSDLERVETYIPVPCASEELEVPEADDLLIQVLDGRHRRENNKKREEPIVVLMAPLDSERVQKFAKGKKIVDIDKFMKAIEAGNLWSFAKRPLDLDWLTAYWTNHNKFGRLVQMIDESLKERLKETDPNRERKNAISTTKALKAAERIGAAMVFGRADKILVPDSTQRQPSSSSELDASRVLPDWPDDQRHRLLDRAAFDPATFGRVKLHGDNEGDVRGFLAAKWLLARCKSNCSTKQLHEMLFSETYGVKLVKPSLYRTAAWLSIWDKDVARVVAEREPEVLLNFGDPASLPLAVRSLALRTLVGRLVDCDERTGKFDHSSLRRFAGRDLGPEIRRIWKEHRANTEVVELVLEMIWLGGLSECVDIADAESFSPSAARHILVFGGRALMSLGTPELRARYAEFVQTNAKQLPGIVIWDALDSLFPQLIGVDGLLDVLANITLEARDETLGLRYNGPRLVTKVTNEKCLERLAMGLLTQLGERSTSIGDDESDVERAYFPAVDAAARALLQMSRLTEAPETAIRAALRLGEERYHNSLDTDAPHAWQELHKSKERRELALWYAVERYRGSCKLQGQPLTTDWQLEFLGWSPGLRMEDVDWLLDGAKKRSIFEDRELALSTAFRLWRDNNKPAAVLAKIKKAADSDARLTEMLRNWLAPRVITEEEKQRNRKMAHGKSKHARDQAKRNKSWIDFIGRLRANPDQLRTLPAPTPTSVDGRLYHLWDLLQRLDDHSARYAIDDISPLIPLVGEAVAEAERDALIKIWRDWKPLIASSRPANSRSGISNVDCMGLSGLAFEAATVPDWPRNLTPGEATLAAQYAMMEINGFPPWLTKLAEEFPDQTRDVLVGEIKFELDLAEAQERYGTLHAVSYGPAVLAQLVAEALYRELSARPALKLPTLRQLLSVLVKGASVRRSSMYETCLGRFETADDIDVRAAYFVAAFRIDPVRATDILSAKLDTLGAAEQTRLAKWLLSPLFGDDITERAEKMSTLPFDVLVRLVKLAYATIRIEDDNHHPNREAYSPDARDDAERARGKLLNQLAETPGRATYEALRRLPDEGFPLPRYRMFEIARNRAANDAEAAAWSPEEAHALEEEFDVAPMTAVDLQRTALSRIEDMNYDLHNADFRQGETLKLLRDEMDVQIWCGHELENRQRRAYSVERESHVAEEKAPDIRLRAKSADAVVPIEIKVAESWTLAELEHALEVQLCQRYLRDRNTKYGLLLLVHKHAPKTKPRLWKVKKGRALTFPQVVEHLVSRANQIGASGPDQPQPVIAYIDVSDIKLRKEASEKRTKRNTKVQKRKKARVNASRKSDRAKAVRAKPKSPRRNQTVKQKRATPARPKKSRSRIS